MRTRTGTILTFALLIAMAGGYSAWWVWIAGQAEERILLWVDKQRRQGVEVEIGHLETRGFPQNVRVETPLVRFAYPDGTRIEADGIALSARPWDLQDYTLVTKGRIRITTGDLSAGIDHLKGHARIAVDGWLERLDLTLYTLTVIPEGGQPIEAATARLEAEQPREGRVSLRTHLLAESLVLPAEISGVLGREVQSVLVKADTTGPVQALMRGAEGVARWREAGGTIEVQAAQTVWGEAQLFAKGSVTLDEDFRPLGAFTMQITGYDDVLDQLRNEGVLSRGGHRALSLLMRLGESRSADGGPPNVTVPLSMQDGYLSLGPVQLYRMEPILPPPPDDASNTGAAADPLDNIAPPDGVSEDTAERNEAATIPERE